MFTIRRSIASLLAAAALGIAACGGDSDSERIQRDAAELRQRGKDLRKDAVQAAQHVQDGKKSAEEAAAEIQQDADRLAEDAIDAATP